MARNNQLLPFFIIAVALFFCAETALAGSSTLKVQEVVSIKTGVGSHNIKNQFGGAIIDPFNGFAVDPKGNVLIGDDGNRRILRFSQKGTLLDSFTLKSGETLIPYGICFDKDENVYVRNEVPAEIIVFSPDRNVLRRYNPGAVVFKNKYKLVPIISLSCDKARIKVVFGVDTIKILKPIYVDEYDQQFNLIKRETYTDHEAYSNELDENDRKLGFYKRFEDMYGNRYGEPIAEEWYGGFMPLGKYTPQGKLLYTIDSKLLMKHTKYNIYDYYTMNKIKGDWRDTRGKDFMIVNWYVTPQGTIYVLLANKDYVKVLKIQ